MSHPLLHAKSSARKHGGVAEDYQAVHDWFDSTKAAYADHRHRAILHNSFGIFLAEQLFGTVIVNCVGKEVPVRLLGEQHCIEDLGFIPTIQDWLKGMPKEPWMYRAVTPLSRILDNFKEANESGT
jgi:hypothetical protein